MDGKTGAAEANRPRMDQRALPESSRGSRRKIHHEKIRILERVMSAGGQTHLILAGSPQRTYRLKKALPKRLADRLVDTVVIDR